MSDQIKCPKCLSTQVYADKKGFSTKKAVVGSLLVGPAGALAGAAGKNKILITCLKCGNVFKPGESHYTDNSSSYQSSTKTEKWERYECAHCGRVTFDRPCTTCDGYIRKSEAMYKANDDINHVGGVIMVLVICVPILIFFFTCS